MSASDTLRLNCPKCQRAVRVRASAVGRRVRCPQCQAEFKVPGQPAAPASAGSQDDDDWLNLDQPLPEPTPPGASTGRSAPASPPTAPNQRPAAGPPAATAGGAEERDPYQLFDEPLPPPASAAKPSSGNAPDGNRSGGKLLSEAELQALAGVIDSSDWSDDQLPPVAGPAVGDAAADDPPDGEFRVTCPICLSVTYARRDQVGKSVRCHDCHSEFKVPAPPRPKPKYKPNLDQAEVYGMEEPIGMRARDRDPFAKSAADLLREAEASDDEEEAANQYDNPDVVGWLRGIFRIFLDPGVPLHWISLAMVGSIPGVLAVALGHPSLMAVTLGAALLYAAFVLACGFSILEAVANGERRVSEWPYLDPGEWLGRLVMVLAAVALAGGPASALGSLVFGRTLATVAFTMLSIYVLFPFILLSMLDSESILMPFSAEVSKSVTRCQEAWGILYLSAGLLFFLLFVIYAATQLMPPTLGVVVNVFATVGATFTYFSMIGQLAYAIGHAVNAPPMKNDIQKQREAERARKANVPE